MAPGSKPFSVKRIGWSGHTEDSINKDQRRWRWSGLRQARKERGIDPECHGEGVSDSVWPGETSVGKPVMNWPRGETSGRPPVAQSPHHGTGNHRTLVYFSRNCYPDTTKKEKKYKSPKPIATRSSSQQIGYFVQKVQTQDCLLLKSSAWATPY